MAQGRKSLSSRIKQGKRTYKSTKNLRNQKPLGAAKAAMKKLFRP